MRAASFNHLVGAGGQGRWHFDAERLRRAQIDHELEPGRLHDRQVGGVCAFENSAGVNAGLTILIRNDCSVAHQAAGCSEFAPCNAWRAASTTSCWRLILKNGEEQTSSAVARCWTRVENAASKSLSTLARSITSCTPKLAAASCTSRS